MNVETNLMLPEYKSLVNILFENKSPILIPNCSYRHNTIINELILKNTPDNGTIYIFSKHLKKKFFENESFLKEVEYSKGKSVLLPSQKREGVVIRNYERNISFKVINPDFLLAEKD